MAEVIKLEDAGYSYINGVFQYSGGVAGLPGYEIVRVRFKAPVPLKEGFELIKQHIEGEGRPLSSFCACELRSPAPFSDAGFEEFNRIYFGTLDEWGITSGEKNPIARSCVCPEVNPPAEPSFYAFSYTRPANHDEPTFVISGSAECPEDKGNYVDGAIRPGDQSEDAMLEKARWVLGEMNRRLDAFSFDWSHATDAHLYTVYGVHAELRREIASHGANPNVFSWHYARPPLVTLDYEMDVRKIMNETVLS